MKELDLGLSKELLSSVSGVLKDSAQVKADATKSTNEQLASHYSKMTARPLSTEEAKVTTYASKAPERRVNDAISAIYSKSVAESAAKAKAESEAIQRAYAARGAAKPISEQKEIDPLHPETLKKRKEKMQADVSDETIVTGNALAEKEHTIPKTEKEKKLAALAAPKDKITHADVLTGRGVRKEGFAGMEAWMKNKIEEDASVVDEASNPHATNDRVYSTPTGTVHRAKPGAYGGYKKDKEEIKLKSPKALDKMDKSLTKGVNEVMSKADIPTVIRKKMGEKPLTMADVKSAPKDSISHPDNLAKARGAVKEETIDEKIIVDKDGNQIGGMNMAHHLMKMPTRVKPSGISTSDSYKRPFTVPSQRKPSNVPAGAVAKSVTKEEVESLDELSLQTMKSARQKLGDKALDAHGDDNKRAARDYANRALSMSSKIKRKERLTKEEVDLEEATHVFSGVSSFMKKHASKLRDAGLKVKKVIHDEDSGTTEYHVAGPKSSARAAGKQLDSADKGQNYGGHFTKEEKDTPGNSYDHQCAVHVKHAKLGEGKTLFSQHAKPDAEGNIAWYDVMFAEGIEKKVPTTDLEILVSESHMNHSMKKKK